MCHLLVKKVPHASRTPVRVSQNPNQHGQEEHCIGHKNTSGIGEAMLCMYDTAGICDGVVRRIELV